MFEPAKRQFLVGVIGEEKVAELERDLAAAEKTLMAAGIAFKSDDGESLGEAFATKTLGEKAWTSAPGWKPPKSKPLGVLGAPKAPTSSPDIPQKPAVAPQPAYQPGLDPRESAHHYAKPYVSDLLGRGAVAGRDADRS